MLLESVSSTAKRAEELLNSMTENKINLETPNIEDHFTGLFHLAGYEYLVFLDVGFWHLHFSFFSFLKLIGRSLLTFLQL